jgi:endonuclease-3 related protein
MKLNEIYNRLSSRFSPMGWWPGDSWHEYFVGCVLAQNTNWNRVVPVIQRMKKMDILAPEKFLQLGQEGLSEVLRGAGTYRRKAEYLRIAGEYMLSRGWNGTPESVTGSTDTLRNELLELKGTGPETCDCILLYVLERPVFVVDAYTTRILSRHGLCNEKAKYSEVQKIFQQGLNPDVGMFNEFHALFVECGKQFCRPEPLCRDCPLNEKRKTP